MKGAADCRIDSRRGQRSRSDSRQKSATISGNLGKLRWRRVDPTRNFQIFRTLGRKLVRRKHETLSYFGHETVSHSRNGFVFLLTYQLVMLTF